MSEAYQGLITITDLTDNKACEIRGVNVFKYNENGEIQSASSSITLTAILSANISGSNWQYKNSLGNFVDFSPITTGDTITINHTDDIFINDIATIKKLTSDESVFDIFTITKIRDGQTGTSPINIVLGNVADVIPCDVDGKLKTDLTIDIPFTAYKGTSQISATITKSNITTRPNNLTDDDITITSSTTSSSGNIQFTLYAGSELGNNSGEITLTFTCDGKQVPMKYGWSKSIQAPPGADGKTYYTWIKYADSPTSGMSDNPSGKAYIGIAHNKTSATESTTYSDYNWSLIKGETGADGNGITTIKQYYARTTTFSKPSAESITSTTMPELDNTYRYLWMKEVIAFTKSENQTVITLIAARGDNGEMSPEQVAQLNKASQDASDAVSKIDSLEIGGRNLILNSETKPISKYIDAITTQTGITVSEWGTKNAIRSYGVCNSNKIFGTLATGSSSPTSVLGQTYVHSIYVKNNGKTPIIISNNGIGDSLTIQPGESTRVILHGTGDNARYLQFVLLSSNLGDAFDVTYWHPKIEIGNKATDWTPAPEDVDAGIANVQANLDNLEIGGRNLFLNTGKTVSNNNYKISEYAPANGPLKAGEIYTATICVTPAENLSEIRVYFSQGYLSPVSFSISGTSKQVISKTFTMAYYDGRTPDVNPSYGYAQLYRFPNDGTVTGNTTVHWFKIEKGNKATDWTPAPEDVDAGIANAANVAANYIHADDINGLVVNNNQKVGVGYDIQLKADGSNTGMNIRQNGNILASFLQNQVSLGKNSISSKVGMCGDKGGVSASFGYYIDSVSSNNAEMGSTLSFDFNETTFKNKVGQKTGFYDFTYTSANGWELFDPVNDTTSKVTLSQYGITMKTPTSSLNDNAQIVINYVLDGSVKFYNADISNPVRKLELEMAENPSSSESDYANITIERQSGTFANGDGKEHSIITMMTLHEFANVATLQLFDDSISLDATHVALTSTHGEGSIQLNGDTYINGIPVQGCHRIATSTTGAAGSYTYDSIGMYMVGTHTVYLEEKISDQLNGIILVWSFYNGGVKNWGWNFTVIPKIFVTDNTDGGGMSTFMSEAATLGNVGVKYFYVRDDRIIGNDNNNKSGTGPSAIKYANNKFVLRWVYGF